MKHLVLTGLSALLIGLSACHKEDAEPSQPDYADWYVVRSPEGRPIEAVAGDLDGTLVISTTFKIYQSKDKGKTWKLSNYSARSSIEGFVQRHDTLLALSATAGSAMPNSIAYAINPSHYSLDAGATWQSYSSRWQPNLEPKVALNQAVSPSGTTYNIDFLLTPTSPGSSSNYIETIGIRSAMGTQLTLPQDHSITSLYFDAKSRLYVTASAALCGRREKFAYCGEPNGLLYISKKPQP
jgi:hypothetical protein